MAEFRSVTEDFAVSGQIFPDDVQSAADQGFVLIINNRPDGEAAGQPTGASIESAAKAASLAYREIPIVGRPSPEQAAAVRAAIEVAAGGKTLAFCRTGNRSITVWALGEAAAGARGREELIRVGRAAGYDLSGVL